jgi:hypothetical protein
MKINDFLIADLKKDPKSKSFNWNNFLSSYKSTVPKHHLETPLILDACEIVTGRILVSFCLASIVIDFIL